MSRLLGVTGFIFFGSLSVRAVTINGQVVSTETPPMYVSVLALELENFGLLASVQADAQGNYAMALPGNQKVVIVAISSSGNIVSGYQVLEYTVESKAVALTDQDVVVDFTTSPAHQFVFQGTIDGQLATDQHYPHMMVLDPNDVAQQVFPTGATHVDSGITVPGMNTPVGNRYVFLFEWTLPQAGRIMVRLDNEGLGFDAGAPGTSIIEVNREIARTAMFRLEKAIDRATVSTIEAVRVQTESLHAFDRGDFDACAGTAIVELENLTIAQAQARIADLRTGTLSVQVKDSTGHPLPNAEVTLTQVDRDFRLGFFDTWNNTGADPVIHAREQGFNFFTSGVYWSESEPQDDQFQWDHLDHEVGISHMDELGYRLKAHPLIWLIDIAMPDYLKVMDFDSIQMEIEEHIDQIVNRYSDVISAWDVINEAHGTAASGGFNREQVTQISRNAVAQVQSLDPTAAAIVNSAFFWHGGDIVSELYEPDRIVPFTQAIPQYVQDLIDHDVALDVIGQQMYNCGCVTFFVEVGLQDKPGNVPTFDLATLDDMLETLNGFSLPVHITEHSIPSGMYADCDQAGYWRVPWSEQNQADYAEAFYTLLFSHPSVEAITWWNLIDKYPFVYQGGLFHADGTPKPVVGRLHQLFTNWSTNVTGETGAEGRFTADVFAGTFDVHVAAPDGMETTQRIHVPERTQRTLPVIVSSTPTPIWIPHITHSTAWRTMVIGDNRTDRTVDAIVTQMPEGGDSATGTWSIPAGGQIAIPLEGGGMGWIDAPDKDVDFRIAYQTQSHQAMAELPLDSFLSQKLHLLLPSYTADQLTWCGAAIANPHSQPVAVTVEGLSPSGQILDTVDLNLPPLSRWVGEIDTLFSEIDWRQVARLRASAELGLTGVVISGREHESLLFTRAVAEPQGTQFFVSHIATDRTAWSNKLVLDHVGDTDATYFMQFYSAGSVVGEISGSLPAEQSAAIDLNQAIESKPDFATCTVSTRQVHIRQSYAHATGSLAEFLLPNDAANHHRIDLHQTLTDAPSWNGLALANPTSLQRYVVIQAHLPHGDTQARIQIKAHDRWRGTLADLFPDIHPHITHLDIRGSGPFTGLRLSGWNDGRLVFIPSQSQLAGRGLGNDKE